MNKILCILKYFSLSVVAMFILVFGISFAIPLEYEERNLNKNETFNGTCSEVKLNAEIKMGTRLWRPEAEGKKELYCISPGTRVRMANDYAKTKQQIQNIVNTTPDSPYTACGEAPHVNTYLKYYSDTYYRCIGRHFTETSTYYGKDGNYYSNLHDIAFIISYKPDSKLPEAVWAPAKQQAIWQSQLVNPHQYAASKSGKSYQEEEGRWVLKASREYQKFYEKILEVKDGKTGMKPKSLLSEDEVALNIDKVDKVGKLGPFKIDYVDGYVYESGSVVEAASFGGITNMYLVDAAGNKIEIKNLIIKKAIDYTASQVYANANIVKMYPADSEEGKNSSYFSNWIRKEQVYNINLIDFLAFQKAYPHPNDEFYVEFDFPEEIVGSVKLHIDFKYLKCEMEICEREAGRYYVDDYCKGHTNRHTHTYTCGKKNCGGHTRRCDDCRGRKAKINFTTDSQPGLTVEYARRYYIEEEFEITCREDLFNTSMKIGGFVFEDALSGKDNVASGTLNKNNDKMLKNVEVTLYKVEKNGTLTLAKLATLKQEKLSATQAEINDPADYTRRINPTLTDEKGYYEFRGLDPTKDYVVKFTYNGQTYTPTEYFKGASGTNAKQIAKNGQYSSVTSNDIWNSTSKVTEITGERNEYDEKFASIGSTPHNYISENSLGYLNGKYNEVFTIYELAGITLQPNGKYVYNANNQLIDTYLEVKNGKINENGTFKEGLISKAIREYIKTNRKYPDLQEIYSKIAGRDTQLWKKFQFIEDCKISAWTKNQAASNARAFDQYPTIDYFTTYIVAGNKAPNNSYSKGTYASGVTTYSNYTLVKNGVNGDALDPADNREIKYFGELALSKGNITYKNVYEGQLFVNCGLWRRPKADLALQKDVYKATIKINGKTETYQYDKRTDQDAYWEIQTRLENGTYYGTTYNRALYPSDYQYSGVNKLEVYITYKIRIRNQSEGILTRIDEVVDYYDNTYTYTPQYSWAMWDDVKIKPSEYYSILTGETKVGSGKFKTASTNLNGEYAQETKYSLSGYDKIYLNGLANTKLAAGDDAYLYLTFKVNEKANKVDIDNDKHNIAEINGYSTFYANGTKLPNGITKNSRDVAGIIDYDSKPGNFRVTGTLRDGTYEYTFEDDTDRAKGIRVWVDNALIRKISGTTWEDKRNTKVNDAYIGNGIKENKELRIPGIKVEMLEVLKDGKLQKPAVMQKNSMETNKEGAYSFEGFIPGNYIIRFTYGGDVTATTKGYNGQDFKSTTYQAEINQSGKTNTGNDSTYYGYTDIEKQNETGTYGYDIEKADAAKNQYSDAKDIWSRRQAVNNYSNGSMKYDLANRLNNDKTLKDSNLQMIADTGVIAIEGEYNRVNSEKDEISSNGYNNINYLNGNDRNGKYHIQNVDFGLEERPKAQLELDKKVSNVKIVLANQNILFDANQTVDNMGWIVKNPYDVSSEKKNNYYPTYGTDKNNPTKVYDNLRNKILQNISKQPEGLIQATMDKELTHGATIQITYIMTVKNIGEVDYNETKFYYTGKIGNAANIVRTSADLIADYVANNLQYRQASNKAEWGWKAVTTQELYTNGKYVNDDVGKELKNYNTIITTEALNKKLIPATESVKGNADTYTKTQLILTQTITAQNDQDDMVYNNIAEIVATTNTVGRRMAFSIQGNQKPSEKPQESDSSMAEPVVILPPFGDTYLYYGIGIAVVVILAGAVIFIKKKVLKK